MAMGAVDNNLLVAYEEIIVSASEERRVLCIIHNKSCESKPPQTINLPVSTPCKQLFIEIRKHFDLFDTKIRLVSVAYGMESSVDEESSKTIGELCGTVRKNTFYLYQQPTGFLGPVREPLNVITDSVVVDALPSEFVVKKAVATSEHHLQDHRDTVAAISSINTVDSASYSYALSKSDTGYVGLVNQAMTCYLNSLLQTLYMTPEFRNGIYRWVFDQTEDASRNIPFQLQRLFLQLQTCKKRAIETTDITKSFGWDSSEAWNQHDVQELCRVMFDALEKTFKSTDQANLINELYQGKMEDYVKCLKCGYVSARLDAYLDLPLVLRPYASQVTYGSVEEALNAFIEPEVLDGNNQYYCGQCRQHCDAHKGLKFLAFPYILTLHLKRFSFDYQLLQRIKLNDRMSFPEVLDLTNFLPDDKSEDSLESQLKDKIGPGNKADGAGDTTEAVDEGIDSDEQTVLDADGSTKSRTKKPHKYELFSIMIHSGNVTGGHYYAYIKSFSDDQWYSFNDQCVLKISQEDIEKTYGGLPSHESFYSTNPSSTNAYMLQYRLIDPSRNKEFLDVADFPQHLKKELASMEEREREEIMQQEMERNSCKIKLCFYDEAEKKYVKHSLEVHKDKTLSQATEMAWRQLDLVSLPLDCFRLVKFDSIHEYIDHTFDKMEDKPIYEVLGGVKTNYPFDLLMEVKTPDEQFECYRTGDLNVKLFEADLTNEEVKYRKTIRIHSSRTIQSLSDEIARVFHVPVEQLRLVIERTFGSLHLLNRPDFTLSEESFEKLNKVYFESSGIDDFNPDFSNTKLYQLLDCFENTVLITISLPPLLDQLNSMLLSRKEQESFVRRPSPEGAEAAKQEPSRENRLEEKTSEVDEGIGESETDVHSGIGSMEAVDGPPSEIEIDDAREPVISQPTDDYHMAEFMDRTMNRDFFADSPQTADIDMPEEEELSNCLLSQDSGSSQTVEVGDIDNPTPQTSPQVSTCGSNSPSSEMVDVEENVKESSFQKESEENWDLDVRAPPKPEKWYFVVEKNVSGLFDRTMTVHVDRRITLRGLKTALEPYMGLSSEKFKIYRACPSAPDVEETRLFEPLSNLVNDGKITVRLGRAMTAGELKISVHQLTVNSKDPFEFLLDVIVPKGTTVLDVKRAIIDSMQKQRQGPVDITPDRCRLRKKTWKNPGLIYPDQKPFDEYVSIPSNTEVFLEILDAPDIMQTFGDAFVMQIYVRRWWPSKFQLDPIQEIVVFSTPYDSVLDELAKISGIDRNNVCFAKARGTFPCDYSVLEIEKELDWTAYAANISEWPISIIDDGTLIYFKDRTEPMKSLDFEERKDLQNKENTRLHKTATPMKFTSKPERALKIYTASDERPDSARPAL